GDTAELELRGAKPARQRAGALAMADGFFGISHTGRARAGDDGDAPAPETADRILDRRADLREHCGNQAVVATVVLGHRRIEHRKVRVDHSDEDLTVGSEAAAADEAAGIAARKARP